MSNEMLASEAFRATKELLIETGWTQGVLEQEVVLAVRKEHQHCIVGALGKVTHNDAQYFGRHEMPPQLRSALHAALVHAGHPLPGGVVLFNDAHTTTFNDVCDMLDLAEKHALIAEEAADGS